MNGSNIQAAKAVGDEIAEKVLKEPRGSETPVSQRARERSTAHRDDGRVAVVAEGDSWFDYPGVDVLDVLESQHGFEVEKVSRRGDRIEDMAYSAEQLNDFLTTLRRCFRRHGPPTAILLSGGGNDIAGTELEVLLNHRSSREPPLNQSIVEGIIDVRLREAFATIIASVTRVARAEIGSAVPVLVHGYGYPRVDGRGYMGGWGPLPGPWLEPAFRRKGYANEEEATQLLKPLIDRFNQMLRGVAADADFAHVHVLDFRGMLRSDASEYRKWWANELHPTKEGFEVVAQEIAAKLRRLSARPAHP